MSRLTLIAELSVFITLSLGIHIFSAHMWDETPRGLIVALIIFSLGLGYHTATFLNKFTSEE